MFRASCVVCRRYCCEYHRPLFILVLCPTAEYTFDIVDAPVVMVCDLCRDVNVGNNQLTGSLSTAVSALTALTALNAGGNQFTGTLDFASRLVNLGYDGVCVCLRPVLCLLAVTTLLAVP